jgi:hypothetical protein
MEFRFNNLKNINTTRLLDDSNFGNHFFYSMVLHHLSEQNNLLSTYKNYNEITKLGIELFVGTRVYTKGVVINDDNFFNFLFTQFQPNKNIILCGHFQTNKFALYLYDYFREDDQQNRIIQRNIYKDRYKSNNDVFVHIKLTDMMLINDPYKYYDLLLSTIKFSNGYISCDNINNSICKYLMNKYNLIHVNYDIVETIMFASTCNNVILSKGTISWVIGILSFYSTVYYPKTSKNFKSNIFVIPEWKEIDET